MRLLASAAESYDGEGKVDTLVMISVLQGVRDVARALQAAYNAIRPGGWIIFSDRGVCVAAPRAFARACVMTTSDACVRACVCIVFDSRWDAYRAAGDEAIPFWDVAHPCAPKQTVVDHFLSAFEEVHSYRFVKEDAEAAAVAAGGGGRRARRRIRVQSSAARDEQLYFIGRKPAV